MGYYALFSQTTKQEGIEAVDSYLNQVPSPDFGGSSAGLLERYAFFDGILERYSERLRTATHPPSKEARRNMLMGASSVSRFIMNLAEAERLSGIVGDSSNMPSETPAVTSKGEAEGQTLGLKEQLQALTEEDIDRSMATFHNRVHTKAADGADARENFRALSYLGTKGAAAVCEMIAKRAESRGEVVDMSLAQSAAKGAMAYILGTLIEHAQSDYLRRQFPDIPPSV